MNARIFLALAGVTVVSLLDLRGQTPAMVVVPAETAALAKPVPVPANANKIASDSTVKFLQEMKVANEGTLKTQAAQLATLDELQKAAEEIKIYSKRG